MVTWKLIDRVEDCMQKVHHKQGWDVALRQKPIRTKHTYIYIHTYIHESFVPYLITESRGYLGVPDDLETQLTGVE